MSADLLPCPFCGSDARTIDNTDDIPTWAQCNNYGNKKKFDIRCVMSHTIVPIAAWNRRPALAQKEAVAPGDERAAFWVLERTGENKTPEYWDGGSSQSFVSDVEKCVHFCRKEDAFWACRGWRGQDTRLTEHMMLARAALAQPVAVDAPSEHKLVASSKCPICGYDEPHSHSDEVVQAYRNDQIRQDDWHSFLASKPRESGWYLCKGVTLRDQPYNAHQFHWFNWVREFAARGEKNIPEALYFDKLYERWSIRNALGNASASGAESRIIVEASVELWCDVPPVNFAAIDAQDGEAT